MKPYMAYLHDIQTQQRAYVRAEFKKLYKAFALYDAYAKGMADLKLHPMMADELVGRWKDLRRMEADIPTTHGDSPANRLAHETWELST